MILFILICHYIKNSLQVGKQYIFRGRIVLKNNRIAFDQPKIVSPQEFAQNVHRLTPVYSATKGLSIAAITKTMHMALDCLNWGQDYLPVSVRQQYGLFDFKAAVTGIHFQKIIKYSLLPENALCLRSFCSLLYLLCF